MEHLSISLIRFINRFNKICKNPNFYSGLYLDGIELTADLKQYLEKNKIDFIFTKKIHVLKNGKMIKKTVLKDYVSIKSLGKYLFEIDNYIHMKKGG